MTNLIALISNTKCVKRLAEAKKLIEEGADINITNNFGATPLHIAALYGHFKICKILIEHGAKINVKCKGGRTPLEFAAICRYTNIIKLLNKYNAKTDTK